MNSRDRIIARLKAVRIKNDVLPGVVHSSTEGALIDRLMTVLQGIGGTAVTVSGAEEIAAYLRSRFEPAGRWISTLGELAMIEASIPADPHALENVQLAIIRGHFAVAENGAVWVTSDIMGDRALPFISEHLAIVINESDIVETMRHAYERIGGSSHDFGTFIAGPSKTADIEQSLVLGAHGPKSLILFIVR